MKIISITLTLLICAMLSGCMEDLSTDYDDDSSSSSSNTSSGSYDFTYTCDTGETYTASIPDGSCSSEYEYYSEVFGCNYVNSMNDAACDLEACTDYPWGCGAY